MDQCIPLARINAIANNAMGIELTSIPIPMCRCLNLKIKTPEIGTAIADANNQKPCSAYLVICNPTKISAIDITNPNR